MEAELASFGQLIKKRREALDLTQVDLAQQLGYTVATISKPKPGAGGPRSN